YKGNAYEAMRPLSESFPANFLGSRTRHCSIDHDLSLPEHAFLALAFSRSYMPSTTDYRRNNAVQDLTDCFAAHGVGGRYFLSYQTVIFATDRF
ncbi:MAG: hypothetical protein KA484_12575, partial [Rhodocyclaceae bacterium]|nr:hypothetical protein [Rhodocyclaceae bacterium]